MSITIELSDELSKRLQEVAAREGVPPEELARVGLGDWLLRPRPDYLEAARFVLEKNRELYRRLA